MIKGRPRLLRGKILLLVLTFLVITGLTHETAAATNASTCSSIMVSTPLCDELLTQACIKSAKEEIPQVQSSVIISSPQAPQVPLSAQTQPEVLPTAIPTEVQQPSTVYDLNSDKIFELVNQYRASLGLAPFEHEDSVCELAKERSIELAGELSNGTIHSGLYNRNLAFWIWENAKVGSNEEGTVAWWLASPLHHQSIVGDFKFSCVKCNGSHCSQLFTSFSPK